MKITGQVYPPMGDSCQDVFHGFSGTSFRYWRTVTQKGVLRSHGLHPIPETSLTLSVRVPSANFSQLGHR